MRNKTKTYAGWSVGLASFFAIATAFPAIADKAASQKQATFWQTKAEAFQDVATNEQTLEITADFTIPALQRDYLQTKSLSPVTAAHVSYARFSAAEQRCMAEAIYYEARSEKRSGQLAVTEVVKNRVKSKHFPNSICGVIYEGSERTTGCQFSFTCDGSKDKRPKGKAWKRSQEMARVSLIGGYAPLTDGATHYHTVNVSPVWHSKLKFKKQIGTHKFYSFPFRERPVPSRSLSIAPPI